MRKYLVYALSAIIALNLFTACGGGNDDEPKPEIDYWKGISKTYQGADAFSALTLNGATVVIGVEGRSVEMKASSTAANITLNNLLPDNAALSMPVTMSASPNFNSFSIQGEADGVKVFGEVTYIEADNNSAETKLSLNITRTAASPVTGNWKLAMAGEQASAEIYIDAQTGDATTDFMLNAFKPVLGSMIGGKVSEVNVLLKEDGTFDVNWINQGETEPTGMPAAIAAMVKIHYFATGNTLMLALDKALFAEKGSINMVAILNSLLAEKGIALDVNSLLGLMTDLGGYYGFPLYYTAVEGGTAFYVDKAILAAMTPVFSPLLASVAPETMLPVLQGIFQSIPTSEKFNFGLVLAK